MSLVAALRRNLSKALADRDLRGAEDILQRLKAVDPLSLPTRGLELELYTARGRLPEASRLAERLLSEHPASPRVHYLAGITAHRGRRYDEAVERLRESQRLSPNWKTERWLSQALIASGKLDEAERILTSLVETRPECLTDMAWLCERRGDIEGALSWLDRRCRQRPEDRLARERRLRLRAQALGPQEIVSEVGELLRLGERPPPEVLPRYLEALLELGRGAEARKVAADLPFHDARIVTSAAWCCHKLQAFDLSYELFRRAFEMDRRNRGNAKLLAALERASRKCGRASELVEIYRKHAPEDRQLYGRALNLSRSISAGPPEKPVLGGRSA